MRIVFHYNPILHLINPNCVAIIKYQISNSMNIGSSNADDWNLSYLAISSQSGARIFSGCSHTDKTEFDKTETLLEE